MVLTAGGQIIDATEFPIFWDAATYPAACKRKIERWPHPDAKVIVDSVQPFRHTPSEDSPLFILHKMDVLDKHQSLIATVAKVDLSVPLRRDLATAAHDAEKCEATERKRTWMRRRPLT